MADNPSAFPKPTAVVDHYEKRGGLPSRKEIECSDGMTLRDWFAGQALAGMAANLTGGYEPTTEEYAHAAEYATPIIVSPDVGGVLRARELALFHRLFVR